MRILFLEKNQALLHGLPHGFCDAGHQVMISGLLTESNLSAMLQRFQPDFIMMTGWGPELTPAQQAQAGEQAKKARVPLIYWAEQDPAFLDMWSLPVALRMQADFVFTVSPESVPIYEAAGIRAVHMDVGYDPKWYGPGESPTPGESRTHVAVVFSPFPYMYRHQWGHDLADTLHTLIWPLLAKGIPARFYGKEWGQMQPFVGWSIPQNGMMPKPSPLEARRVYQEADIVIELQSSEQPISQRMLEAAACGSLLLAREASGLRRLFTPGHDMLASSSPLQTAELLSYYMEKSDERRELQTQAMRTVQAHTYEQRAQSIMRTLVEEGIVASDRTTRLQREEKLLHLGQPICSSDMVHAVKPGESLWGIAQTCGISIGKLREANRLVSDLIQVGQFLRIPQRTAEDDEQCRRVKKWLDKAARLFQLDPCLLYGIAYAESDFGQNAGMSTAGAFGIMQLKQKTAQGLGVDRNDPWQNIVGGAMYIKELLHEFAGDLPMALGAYNWGKNHVRKAAHQADKQWLMLAPEETQHYVVKILKYMSEAGSV
ncbi:spore protein [Brevibacillus parabrevis]|uniref:glycosyltransferase family protein n=1 Tax=Brevibacillus parabrevis TaxID=54914 RepID=UPI0007AB54B8|nr:transglycosylase SLT domain-containing protein [Brevibacillus parabrevis]KZE49044.1 spore protein [Brevibacillus parabrevis]